MHLAADPGFAGSVVVVEKDPTYQFSASALSAASIRQQYSSPVNVAISLYGIGFLREIGERLSVDGDRPDIGLHEGGYLYLAGEAGAPVLREVNALQTGMGADIQLFDPPGLQARFPWLDTEGVAAASWGRSGEGWFDGWGMMQAFRRKARSLGVVYVDDEVTAVEREGGRVVAVRLAGGGRIACGALVDAAGASGGRQVAAMAGVDIPVVARKRCVFAFTCRGEVDGSPLVIDTSGVWFRPEGRRGAEGQMFICGGPPSTPEADDEPDAGRDFEVEWSLFEEVYWPALATRVPAFEAIRPGRAWAGHYDMCTLDHNAIVGRAVGAANFYLATGFSGHGLQQAPAVGRGLAELVAHGAYRTLDLSALGHERIVENRPLLERNVI
ncbi:FAD-binding oxidoreductase [Alsobacter sp. SYSU M60028]|uniref:FAD-binding oxidoreductase n=2 Tax=Alsobacter ponti TaxID=2962936 RepID=A0ABT1LDJ2_9HYPH|nr:FAD-binding oxidoreductase [Alsobacter ponti]